MEAVRLSHLPGVFSGRESEERFADGGETPDGVNDGIDAVDIDVGISMTFFFHLFLCIHILDSPH